MVCRLAKAIICIFIIFMLAAPISIVFGGIAALFSTIVALGYIFSEDD